MLKLSTKGHKHSHWIIKLNKFFTLFRLLSKEITSTINKLNKLNIKTKKLIKFKPFYNIKIKTKTSKVKAKTANIKITV